MWHTSLDSPALNTPRPSYTVCVLCCVLPHEQPNAAACTTQHAPSAAEKEPVTQAHPNHTNTPPVAHRLLPLCLHVPRSQGRPQTRLLHCVQTPPARHVAACLLLHLPLLHLPPACPAQPPALPCDTRCDRTGQHMRDTRRGRTTEDIGAAGTRVMCGLLGLCTALAD